MTWTGAAPAKPPESITTDVLIVGAGPYGLSLSARLHAVGISHLMVGEPMGFWRRQMPAGMYLRSSWDWHLDPEGIWTIERFCDERGISRQAIKPFALSDYLEYVDWLQARADLTAEPWTVARIEPLAADNWLATTLDGRRIESRAIVLAIGFSSFAQLPSGLLSRVPPARIGHTLDRTRLNEMAGQKVVIVGGRQSAFEWAALLAEAGAEHVDIVHRHPSPTFAEADWAWVTPVVDQMLDDPGWYRSLSDSERQTLSLRLWGEGRLKIEPWLEPRLANAPVSFWPETEIASVLEQDERLSIRLTNGTSVTADQIILATGYQPRLNKVRLLSDSALVTRIRTIDGMPSLDLGFQTSLPGLYVTSMLAIRDFGPFFAFTVAARTSAIVIGRALERQLA